jgi:hypothetical protein
MKIKDGSSCFFLRMHLPIFYTIRLKDTLLSTNNSASHCLVSIPSFSELQLKIIYKLSSSSLLNESNIFYLSSLDTFDDSMLILHLIYCSMISFNYMNSADEENFPMFLAVSLIVRLNTINLFFFYNTHY